MTQADFSSLRQTPMPHPSSARHGMGMPTSLGLALVLASALSACALPPPTPSADASSTPVSSTTCLGDLGATGNTRLAAIQQMLSDGKPYAALAELDALGARTPKAQLVRAEALRRVDRMDQARQIYAALTQTCLNGEAQHGLGLLAGREGRLADSLQALRSARQALPTNAAIRNDLGYALMLDGQWSDAQFELLTALDLAPSDGRVQRNLVLLALLQDKASLARELSARFGLDAAAQERLRAQALNMERGTPRANARPPMPAADGGAPVSPQAGSAAAAPVTTTPP